VDSPRARLTPRSVRAADQLEGLVGELKPLLRTLADLDCTDADDAEADSMAVSRRFDRTHIDP
jgi:hypothetical protein